MTCAFCWCQPHLMCNLTRSLSHYPSPRYQCLIITLPITKVPMPQHTVESQSPTLLMRLLTQAQQWEHSLCYKIRPHANLHQLHRQLAQGKKILIFSNASVNHKGRGTLAWILHPEKKLWSGGGIAPSPPSEMYSGLAEAYSVYTALSFLAQYNWPSQSCTSNALEYTYVVTIME